MAGQSVATLVSSVRSGQLDVASLVPTIATYLRIAHQVPGRIRFKVDAAILHDPVLREAGEKGLSGALGHIRGVRDIRLNKLARSCTIEYDRAVIADTAWADLLAARATPAAQALLGIIEDKVEEACRGQL